MRGNGARVQVLRGDRFCGLPALGLGAACALPMGAGLSVSVGRTLTSGLRCPFCQVKKRYPDSAGRWKKEKVDLECRRSICVEGLLVLYFHSMGGIVGEAMSSRKRGRHRDPRVVRE